ncbi:MAG: hypothetical protein NTAFB01_44290 [Nitrospira sp.]
MTLRRRRDMYNVWFSNLEQNIDITKIIFYRKSFVQLLGHEFFSVADANNLTIRNSHQLLGMSVRYFAASYDANF